MNTIARSLICVVAFGVTYASAQPATSHSEADRLFEDGRALARDGDHAAACDRFARSLALEPALGTQLNLADCREKLGHLRESWQLFVSAAAESERTGDASRAAFARKRAAAVEAMLATVVIELAEPAAADLAVTIAGRAVAPTAVIRERVDPGAVEIVATAPGRPRFSRTVQLAPGATTTLAIPARVDPPPPAEPRRSRGRVRLAWVTAGAGGGALLLAGLITLEARSDYNAIADGELCTRGAGGVICDDEGDRAIAKAQRLADLGTGIAIGGGLALGAALAIYLTAPREPAIITPAVSATGVGLALTTRF